MKDVIVIGTSDLFEMAETALDDESYRVRGYLAPEVNSHSLYSRYQWLGTDDVISSQRYREAVFLVALYDNRRRGAIVDALEDAEREVLTLVHPSSTVMPSATLGRGTTVAFHCTVSSAAKLGRGVAVRSQVHVSHDVSAGDFCFFGPGVRILGGATLGEFVLVGSNAVIFPCVEVGAGATVGAGMIVTKDVPSGVTVHPGMSRDPSNG